MDTKAGECGNKDIYYFIPPFFPDQMINERPVPLPLKVAQSKKGLMKLMQLRQFFTLLFSLYCQTKLQNKSLGFNESDFNLYVNKK